MTVVREPTSVLPRGYFPEVLAADPDGLVRLGGVLRVDTVLEAYARGVFPWSGRHPIPWYCLDPRLVLEPAQFYCARSLAGELRRRTYEVRIDTDFLGVMEGCARTRRPGQPGTWITRNMFEVYGELHRLGYGHSVEAYDASGALLGGLYGLSLGLAFFGESMFFRGPNASKVALHGLCRVLVRRGFHLVDCQQVTPHLMTLGARPIPRPQFLERLGRALAEPTFRGSWSGWAALLSESDGAP